jgi:hypothetical protein
MMVVNIIPAIFYVHTANVKPNYWTQANTLKKDDVNRMTIVLIILAFFFYEQMYDQTMQSKFNIFKTWCQYEWNQ